MATITPVLTNFVVAPRVYGTAPFDLTNPVSTNTNPAATFTFISSNVAVADISGRTVTIVSAGQTMITATQAATTGFSSATITANFTVNIATPTLLGFTIAPKSFGDISFALTDPSSNSAGVFSFRSLTTDIVTVTGRVATIKSVGRAQIEATQFPATNYARGSIVAEFEVLTSIVRVGVQNQIDLSWNIPTENGATIKNYFFYVEERTTSVVPAPAVSTVVSSIAPVAPGSYYSYALPVPYSAQILAADGNPTGIDLNSTTQFLINTSLSFTNKNYIDLGYYGEIEISWEYHNDRPITELNPNLVASTTMTISLWKELSATPGDGRVNLLLNNVRTYDSVSNCLGPRPQNNAKTITDIFNIEFDDTAIRELKYLKPTDIISGSVQLSSLSYSPADAPASTREYSIIVKSIRIVPFRFPITRDFTSIGFGLGSSAVGTGFVVSSANASAPLAAKGILYHMPKMTRPLSDFNQAAWSFSWNYAANLARLATDISYLPISGGNITNLNIPFTMRVRGYSRPYARVLAAITVEEYNTTNVSNFLINVGDARYHTRILFDVSLNYNATYSQITGAGTTTAVFDISGASGFPAFTAAQDTSHTQFVFLFQLTITDPSYNAYFRSLAADADAAADAFQVKMLSQTLTPRQEYRFGGADPTLASSNSLTSATNTLYNISNPYTNILPFYRFYGLTNGSFYSFKIASNNIVVGTTTFSDLFTRRCGSVPNQIVNTVNSAGADTLAIESENTSNQVNIYWDKPAFSGYEIQYFVIQMNIDVAGKWLNILDYTPDISHNTITFDTFQDTNVIVTSQSRTEYDKTINSYIYKTSGLATAFTQQTGIPVGVSGALINGYKYYFRLASVNELGYSAFSTVLSGIPFARPSNSPITFIGNQVVGNQLVYLTWKIPNDDAGSPILNYIIDYEDVTTNADGNKTYSNKRRYKLDIDEPMENKRPSYPFDDFRTVYRGYKRFALLSEGEQKEIAKLRAELTRYIIPPTPITINDSDYNLSPSLVENRNVRLSYLSQSFTFISSELTQNVFDISNIQLKWYYFNDPTGAPWNDDVTTVSFRMSMRGHLKAVAGSAAQDISNIFFISGDTATGGVTYTVSRPKLSELGIYKYIDYTNGNIISGTVEAIPKIFIPTLPSVDASNNSRRYSLKIDYQITYLSPGANRFILYSGPIIINGTAPVRTGPGINTRFTLKLQNKINSPIENREYRFTVTPFNINDYFPDNTTPTKRSQVTLTIGITNSEPIADMSYTLISTSLGGKVRLQWRYSSPSDYYINIEVPKKYQNSNFPQEYPMLSDGEITRSIKASNLIPVGSIVSFTIPSDNPADNAQLYLKSGRQYAISVVPVRIVEVDNAPKSLVAESRNMTPDDVYIVPFRVPLRPLLLTAQGNPGVVALKWKLPNIAEDPNFYITDSASTYYRYRYYTIERRDISANPSPDAPWTVVAPEIAIPEPENGGSVGYETAYTVSGLINENNQQFRVRLMIINDFNGQRAFSEWTHMSVINNVAVPESSVNIIYPSVYPYKPSAPVLQFADRTATTLGTLNGLSINFIYPTYNGNADYYECEVYYTPVGSFGGEWRNIFSVSDGIANIADNTAILVDGKIRTSGAVGGVSPGSQQITVICKSTVLAYGIRIRVIGRKNGIVTSYPYVLYSDYSAVDYIEI
jgi:hypothetical protein